MNCNCLTRIPEEAQEKFPEFRITGVALMMPDFEWKPQIEADYIPKGKTKRKKLPITASYCPFCGKEI